MRRIWCFLTAVAVAQTVPANPQRPAPFEPYMLQRIFDAAALDPKRLDPSKIESGLTTQDLSFVGREDLALTRRPARDMVKPCKAQRIGDTPADPISTIVEHAAGRRIVMINERHDHPQDRVFIGDVLTALNAQGFSIYAAETFALEVMTNSGPAPRLSDGYYAKEPMFGETLRAARRMNMSLVSYEQERPNPLKGANARYSMPVWDTLTPAEESRRTNLREETQAQNLMERAVSRNVSSKIVVHAGYGHIQEIASKDPDGFTFTPMAARLKAMAGIDPLTIDITQAVSPTAKPVVCEVSAKTIAQSGRDLFVALPAVTFQAQRPTYMVERGARRVKIPIDIRDPSAWSIVEARHADEPDDAVPADRLLLRPGEDIPLILKPGKYRVVAWTRENGWTIAAPVTVE